MAAVVAGWLSVLGGDDTWFSFAARCGVIVVAFAIGDSQRSRAALLESLRAQAERAESLRVLEVQRAAADERARIAPPTPAPTRRFQNEPPLSAYPL